MDFRGEISAINVRRQSEYFRLLDRHLDGLKVNNMKLNLFSAGIRTAE